MMARPRNPEPVDILRGVERAAALLQRFTPDRPVVDLPRQTSRRSLAVARLGQAALAGVDLRLVARPHLRRLVDETGESSFLLVVEGRSAVVIDTVASDAPLRLTYPVGTPWPLYAGASNKVLLAHLPEEIAAEVLSAPLPRIT